MKRLGLEYGAREVLVLIRFAGVRMVIGWVIGEFVVISLGFFYIFSVSPSVESQKYTALFLSPFISSRSLHLMLCSDILNGILIHSPGYLTEESRYDKIGFLLMLVT